MRQRPSGETSTVTPPQDTRDGEDPARGWCFLQLCAQLSVHLSVPILTPKSTFGDLG